MVWAASCTTAVTRARGLKSPGSHTLEGILPRHQPSNWFTYNPNPQSSSSLLLVAAAGSGGSGGREDQAKERQQLGTRWLSSVSQEPSPNPNPNGTRWLSSASQEPREVAAEGQQMSHSLGTCSMALSTALSNQQLGKKVSRSVSTAFI